MLFLLCQIQAFGQLSNPSKLKSTRQIFLNQARSVNSGLESERENYSLCDEVDVISSEQDEIYLQTKNNCDGYKVEYISEEFRDIILPNYNLNGELSSWKAEFNIHSSVNGQKYVFAANTQDESREMKISFERRKNKFYAQLSYGGESFKQKHLPSTDGHLTVTIIVKESSSVKIKVGKTGDTLEYLLNGTQMYAIVDGTKFKYVAIGDGPKIKTTFGKFKFFSKQIVEKNTQVYSQEISEQESKLSPKNNCVFLSIANDKYNIKPLDGEPTKDAKQLIEFYKRNGFDIVKIENFKNKIHLITELKKNKTKIKNADVLIVHYGGHGAILDGNEHYLLPTSYKSNDLESRVNYPKTTFVMETLQVFLSEGSQRYKLMHFTADACQDIVPTKDRAVGAKLTDWNVRLVNNSKVYSILRQSTFAQETADNLNGYSDALIDHLREYEQLNSSIQDINIFKMFKVNSKGASKANDKYFGPDGEINVDPLKDYIKAFKLNMSFDEYIRKNKFL